MSTNVAKPGKVAIIGASGTYGTGILARAEEIGVELTYNLNLKKRQGFTEVLLFYSFDLAGPLHYNAFNY